MPRRTALRALADRMGILAAYVDVDGHRHPTSDDTRAALLHAMRVDGADEPAARRELERLDAAARERVIAPVVLLAAGTPRGVALHVRGTGRAEWHATLTTESGERRTLEGSGTPERTAIELRDPLPPGYHELRVTLRDALGERSAMSRVIAAPARCVSIQEQLGSERAAGVLANLYSIRSDTNWGCGDLGDLRRLTTWTAQHGGRFVGINPLHALRDRGASVSPYSPVSRLFNNPIYLDVRALPELAKSPDAAALVESEEFQTAITALRAADRIDYERVMLLKRRVLELLHRTFAKHDRDGDRPRGRAYAAYRQAHGETLDRFATFCALTEQMSGPGGHGAQADWHDWPAPLRDPRSAAVIDFARGNAESVDFHRWMQFALDQQLAEASGKLGLGIYRDLAVGSAPDSCDVWAWPELFARDATVGAPPDDFSADGQNWGLPPVDPHALRDDEFRYWVALLRANLAHGGALRIDHVMGLFRLFWVPAGESARDGAYVRYPAEELLHIIALESHRHGAVIVGENLGTVPPEVTPALHHHGILSSAVLYFERTTDGAYRAAESYPRRALVSVGTHDHVPLAGFWNGRDLEIHRDIGLLRGGAAFEAARTERDEACRALAARFTAEGVLSDENPDATAIVRAAHAFLGRTPSQMVGVALDDLAMETDPVNVPGTTEPTYPNWRRRMHRPLDDVLNEAAAEALRAAARTPPPRTPPSA